MELGVLNLKLGICVFRIWNWNFDEFLTLTHFGFWICVLEFGRGFFVRIGNLKKFIGNDNHWTWLLDAFGFSDWAIHVQAELHDALWKGRMTVLHIIMSTLTWPLDGIGQYHTILVSRIFQNIYFQDLSSLSGSGIWNLEFWWILDLEFWVSQDFSWLLFDIVWVLPLPLNFEFDFCGLGAWILQYGSCNMEFWWILSFKILFFFENLEFEMWINDGNASKKWQIAEFEAS